MMWFSLSVCTSFLILTDAVDRGNFKTCDQSGFCKRQRTTFEGALRFRALLNTVTLIDGSILFKLVNKYDTEFNAELFGLQSNTIRLRVSEKEELVPRYEPPIGDVLVEAPIIEEITIASEDSQHVVISYASSKINLYANPFRIDILTDGEPVISINARNLFNFEHTRNKPTSKGEDVEADMESNEGEEHAGDDIPAADDKQEDDNTMWEETFKTYKDTKPHGPQSVGLDFSFPGFQYVYGIPEHADTLALKTTKHTDPYRLYNLDVFEYEIHNPMALYGSVPYMIAHNQERTVGLFWLNTAETWIDIQSNTADKNMFSKLYGFVAGDTEIPQVDTHWFSESGIIDVFIMLGPTPGDVFSQYALLTGTTSLPPLFSLAYHQSRWNYNDEQDVANVDAGFDQHNIPMDVIWLDIEHTDGKRYFTWDQNKFPDSKTMIDNVASKSRKMVTIIDPHIKRDDNYHIHKESRAGDFYIKDKDGADYDGWCWPGSSSWLDFTEPSARSFWASKFAIDDYVGSTLDLFTWNDMNEPSVFNGPEITMHKDAKHANGVEHRDVHNMYGTYVHRATVEGQLKRDPDQRPFVLSRAFFAGSQRYGAVWTGDNTGEWSHLKISLPMTLSLNIAGITFSGADIGGFFKNPETELLTRWYQAGAFMPFFRAHAHLDTKRREPWLQPDEHKTAIRLAIIARYKLLPYWYTLFYMSSVNGHPVVKPLWVELPHDQSTFTVEDEFFVGSGLLVHPITDNHATGVHVFFPGANEIYYDYDMYAAYRGDQTVYIEASLDKIPVFYRGGSIIPRKDRIRRSSYLSRNDPYTLVVALDRRGSSRGDLYIDDYKSFQYQRGHYAHRKFVFENNRLVNSNGDMKGSFRTPSWLERVIIIGLKSDPHSIKVTSADGTERELTFKYQKQNDVVIVRKPDVMISEDWTITLQ